MGAEQSLRMEAEVDERGRATRNTEYPRELIFLGVEGKIVHTEILTRPVRLQVGQRPSDTYSVAFL